MILIKVPVEDLSSPVNQAIQVIQVIQDELIIKTK